MSANWGVIEERDEAGKFIAYHVMPMVTIDGECVVSDAHTMSDGCSCHPFLRKAEGGWDIWDHHDPDHPGSIEKEEEKRGLDSLEGTIQ